MDRRFSAELYLRANGPLEFELRFFVVCPNCGKQATVAHKPPTAPHPKRPWRLSCTHCGHNREAAPRSYAYLERASPNDWYFHQLLWLQTPCCGQILWAHNERHLDYMEQYVASGLRDDVLVVASPFSGFPTKIPASALSAKFPSRTVSAKNRDEVLRCIAKLKSTVGNADRR